MNFKLFFLRIKKLIFIIFRPHLFYYFLKYKVLPGYEHIDILKIGFDIIIDVGANKGQFSLIAKEVNECKIFAFEPLKYAANIYEKIFASNTQIKLYKHALGSKKSRQIINISAKDDSSSIFDITINQTNYFKGTEKKGELEIKIAPLSSCLNSNMLIKKTLLKIDVQGFELEVLKGSKKLFKNIDYIYCECSYIEFYASQPLVNDIINFLHQEKFNLIGIHNQVYSNQGKHLQADFLFKNTNISS